MLRSLSSLQAVALAALLAPATAGCFRTQARTVPEMPPLDAPAPPPRIVDAAETEAPPPIGLVEEPARNTPPRLDPEAPARRPEPARLEPPKSEPAATEGSRTEPRPAPPTTLQTTPVEREAELEQTIRTLIRQAATKLGGVNPNGLGADARTQYDQAKRFISQAEEALRAKNLVFAHTVADKAAILAGQLSGR
jgi:hypothetical protein